MKNLKLHLTTLCFSLSLFTFWAFAQTNDLPNIVVIVADDLGYADTYWDIPAVGGPDGYVASKSEADGGANGYVALATRNLNRLYNQSWFFNNAYTSGNTCAPTRTGLLTGAYQQRHGVYSSGDGGLGIPNSILTIPRLLGDKYDKMAIGKWHVGEDEAEHSPTARGFDHFMGYLSRGSHDYWAMTDSEYQVNKIDIRGEEHTMGQYVEYEDKWYYSHEEAVAAGVDFEEAKQKGGRVEGFTFDNNKNRMIYQINGNTNAGYYNVDDSDYTEGAFAIPSYETAYHNLEETQVSKFTDRKAGIYMSDLLTNQALRFINNDPLRNGHPEDGAPRGDGNKPFFLYLGYTAVHTDNTVPTEWHETWKRRIPKNAKDADPDLTISEDDWNHDERASLMAMLDNMDDGVGKIVRLLKEKREWNNTIFIFLSDNGGASGMMADSGSLRLTKQWNFEGGIRTPFIFSWPQEFPTNRQGLVVDTKISSIDVFPTIVDGINRRSSDKLKVEEGTFDGKSILDLLTEKSNRDETTRDEYMFFTEGGHNVNVEAQMGEFAIINTKTNKKLYARVIENDGRNGEDKSLRSVDDEIRGITNFWMFDMGKKPGDTGYSPQEGFESDELDLVKNVGEYHNNTELLDMLIAYHEWLEPLADPIRPQSEKEFYPIIGKEHFEAEDSGVILRVYDDIYYNGNATDFYESDEFNELTFEEGEVLSLVVAPGRVATLTDFNNEKMIVEGTGKPLLVNGFFNNVRTITMGGGKPSCPNPIEISDNGATQDASEELLIDGDKRNRWRADNRDSATLTLNFCEEASFKGINMNYVTRTGVVQYANVFVNGERVYTGYDPINNKYISNEGSEEFFLDTGIQTTNEVTIEVYSYYDNGLTAEHTQNYRPELTEIEVSWVVTPESAFDFSAPLENNELTIWNTNDHVNVSYPTLIEQLDVISLTTNQTVFTYHNANSTILKINKFNLNTGLYIFKATTVNNEVVTKTAYVE